MASLCSVKLARNTPKCGTYRRYRSLITTIHAPAWHKRRRVHQILHPARPPRLVYLHRDVIAIDICTVHSLLRGPRVLLAPELDETGVLADRGWTFGAGKRAKRAKEVVKS